MASANDLRKGMAIKYNGEVCVVLETQHRTPGNLRAFVQASLRSLRHGRTSDVRFSSTEKVEVVPMETRKLEYSYKDQTGYHFIDSATYEETVLQEDLVGHAHRLRKRRKILGEKDRPRGQPLPNDITGRRALPAATELRLAEMRAKQGSPRAGRDMMDLTTKAVSNF